MNPDSIRKILKSSQEAVLLFFKGEDCDQSLMMAPVVETCAKEFTGRIRLLEVSVDKHQDIAGEFHVRETPVILLFLHEKLLWKKEGLLMLTQLLDLLEESLSIS